MFLRGSGMGLECGDERFSGDPYVIVGCLHDMSINAMEKCL